MISCVYYNIFNICIMYSLYIYKKKLSTEKPKKSFISIFIALVLGYLIKQKLNLFNCAKSSSAMYLRKRKTA